MKAKTCTKCEKEKTLNDFYKSKKGKYGCHSICKLCQEKARKERKKKRRKEKISNYTKIKSLNGEKWKDINNYEGIYQVSNLGRIKSLERFRKTRKFNGEQTGYIQEESLRKLKVVERNNTKYNQITLIKDGKPKTFYVHRLVAKAFIKNPHNKYYVNHKDGNGLNNKVDNLEWVTNKQNQKHSANILKNNHNKPIIAYNKKTMKKELEFEIMSNAARWLLKEGKTKDKTCLTGIIKCCKHKIPSYLGYIWRYQKEVVE